MQAAGRRAVSRRLAVASWDRVVGKCPLSWSRQMPRYKSFRYKAKATWSSARRGTLAAEGRPNILVGSPPEFKGEGNVWAPEELLVGSVNTCMMLTFLSLAQARGFTPVGYES